MLYKYWYDYGIESVAEFTTMLADLSKNKSFTKIAQDAKKKVYLGTITPFKGAGYYSRFHEAARLYVNDWIRSQAKNVDGILDFDELLRDPKDNEQQQKAYRATGCIPTPQVINSWVNMQPEYSVSATLCAHVRQYISQDIFL